MVGGSLQVCVFVRRTRGAEAVPDRIVLMKMLVRQLVAASRGSRTRNGVRVSISQVGEGLIVVQEARAGTPIPKPESVAHCVGYP